MICQTGFIPQVLRYLSLSIVKVTKFVAVPTQFRPKHNSGTKSLHAHGIVRRPQMMCSTPNSIQRLLLRFEEIHNLVPQIIKLYQLNPDIKLSNINQFSLSVDNSIIKFDSKLAVSEI